MNKKIIFTIFLIVGCILLLYGIVQFLTNTKQEFDTSKSEQSIFGRDDMSNLLNLNLENAIRKTKREEAAKKMALGVILIFIGVVVRNLKVKSKSINQLEIINQLEKLGQLRKDNLITEEEFSTQKDRLLTNNQENISEFKTESELKKNFIEWITKNKKYFKWAFAIPILIIVFLFVFKDDPESDGKKSAQKFCDCENDKTEESVTRLNEYVNSFNGYNFKRRVDAYEKYEEITKSVEKNFNECQAKAYEINGKFKNIYNYNKTLLTKFNKAYQTQFDNCNAHLQNGKYFIIKNSCDSLLMSIYEPPPEPTRIMNDLIGKSIGSWNFDKLNEFKSFEINSTKTLKNKIELIVLTNLQGVSEMASEAELVIYYAPSANGWSIDGVRANYRAFLNNIPSDGWLNIKPLKDCKMTWDMSKKIAMKTSQNSNIYLFGPDSSEKEIPSSNEYYIQSREGTSVLVKFKYYLKSQMLYN